MSTLVSCALSHLPLDDEMHCLEISRKTDLPQVVAFLVEWFDLEVHELYKHSLIPRVLPRKTDFSGEEPGYKAIQTKALGFIHLSIYLKYKLKEIVIMEL